MANGKPRKPIATIGSSNGLLNSQWGRELKLSPVHGTARRLTTVCFFCLGVTASVIQVGGFWLDCGSPIKCLAAITSIPGSGELSKQRTQFSQLERSSAYAKLQIELLKICADWAGVGMERFAPCDPSEVRPMHLVPVALKESEIALMWLQNASVANATTHYIDRLMKIDDADAKAEAQVHRNWLEVRKVRYEGLLNDTPTWKGINESRIDLAERLSNSLKLLHKDDGAAPAR